MDKELWVLITLCGLIGSTQTLSYYSSKFNTLEYLPITFGRCEEHLTPPGGLVCPLDFGTEPQATALTCPLTTQTLTPHAPLGSRPHLRPLEPPNLTLTHRLLKHLKQTCAALLASSSRIKGGLGGERRQRSRGRFDGDTEHGSGLERLRRCRRWVHVLTSGSPMSDEEDGGAGDEHPFLCFL